MDIAHAIYWLETEKQEKKQQFKLLHFDDAIKIHEKIGQNVPKDENKIVNFVLENKKIESDIPPNTEEDMLHIHGLSINSKPRADGRFQAYITDNGVKHYLYGRSKNEIVAKVKELLKNGLPKSKKVKKQVLTLAEWSDKWLRLYKLPNLKPSSIRSLRGCLTIINGKFGAKKITELKADELQEFFVSMPAERQRDLCIGTLNRLLDKARKQGLIKSNPCETLEIKRHITKRKAGLTPDEQQKLILAVKNTALEPIFNLLLVSGLRVGELLALTGKDVDYEHNIIDVNKDVVFIGGERIEQTTKTDAGIRKVPIPARYMRYFPRRQGLLFPISYNAVRCGFRRLQEKTKINVTAHILRHTYSDRLEEAGVPPKIKQYLLGHAKLDTTQNIYTDTQWHYILSNLQAILSAFDTKTT